MQVKTHREVLEPRQTDIKGDLIQHKPTSFGKELSASISKDSTCKPKKEEPTVPTTVLDITRINPPSYKETSKGLFPQNDFIRGGSFRTKRVTK